MYSQIDIKTFNVLGKPDSVFDMQISGLSAPIIVEDFLSASELKYLIECEASKSEELREHRPNRSVTTVTFDNWQQEEQKLLRHRLEKYLGHFEVWGGNYFSSSIPYNPHVDTGTNFFKANYKNVVIPLSIEPREAQTHLILFDQHYFGNSTGFYRNGRGVSREWSCNDNLYDYSRVFNLRNNNDSISNELLEKHLRHLDSDNLIGFSVAAILPWKIGSCLIFDSSQIHCSSDFKHSGVTRKMASSLFTYRC